MRWLVVAVLAGCSSRSAEAPPQAVPPPKPAPAPAYPEVLVTVPRAAAAPVRFVEARLGAGPKDPDRARGIVWSATGREVAYIREVDGGEQVVVNDRPQRMFAHVDQLELAGDGTPVYVGTDGSGARLVAGDRLGTAADRVLILHDAADAPFHYLVTRGAVQTLVVDGHAGPPVSTVEIEHLAWLPDGRAAYLATADGAARVVIGTELGPAYAATTLPSVARSGEVAYGAQEVGGAWAAVRDRQASGPVDAHENVALGPEGELAYVTPRTTVMLGARELGPYDRATDLAYEGRHSMVRARTGERWFAIIDGVAGPGFAGIGARAVSADGAHVVYVAHLRDSVSGPDAVVRDGTRGPDSGGEVSQLTWSPDGTHLAYVVRGARSTRVVADGIAGPEMEDAGSPAFDADGHVVYEARRAAAPAWCIVRGAAPSCYDDVGEPELIAADPRANFALSPDGHHLAFRARKGDRWLVVVDGREASPENLVSQPRWSTDGTQVGYGARTYDAPGDGALWWRVQSLR